MLHDLVAISSEQRTWPGEKTKTELTDNVNYMRTQNVCQYDEDA